MDKRPARIMAARHVEMDRSRRLVEAHDDEAGGDVCRKEGRCAGKHAEAARLASHQAGAYEPDHGEEQQQGRRAHAIPGGGTRISRRHIQDGSVRGLAVAAPERVAVLPDILTMAEAGYSGVQGGAWFALFEPAGTPTNIIDLLNKAGREAFNAPDVRQRLEPRGVVLVLGTPAELGAHVAADTARWAKVIREAGIKLE